MHKFLVLCSLVAVTWGASVPEDVRPVEEHIVGGTTTDISQVPYVVSVLFKGAFFCGGSIVSEKLVVTAAHCLVYKEASEISFRAGSSKLNTGGTVIQARETYIHPKYNGAKLDYDVAVAELRKPFKFSETIQPIKLVDYEPVPENTALASGWGKLKEGGVNSEVLQTVKVPVVDREFCAQAIKSHASLTNRMFCAGVKGKDSCQGDSGGPLMVDDRLAGIVSFGVGCGRDKQPGVYTNIAHFAVKNFIKIFLE